MDFLTKLVFVAVNSTGRGQNVCRHVLLSVSPFRRFLLTFWVVTGTQWFGWSFTFTLLKLLKEQNKYSLAFSLSTDCQRNLSLAVTVSRANILTEEQTSPSLALTSIIF